MEDSELHDELTTDMHAEFMEDEMSAFDLNILAVCSAMWRLGSLKLALKKYPDISFDDFKNNIARVMECWESWDEFYNEQNKFIDVL